MKYKRSGLKWILCGLCCLLIMLLCSGALAADAGNLITGATSITVNKDYTDSISSMDDVDYFKFTLSAPGPVSITFSHDYVNESNTRWGIKIVNENDKEMILRTFRPNALSAITTCNLGLPAGTFYVRISRDPSYYAYCNASYTFRVNYTASNYWESEFNDNISSQGDPIQLNKEYSGVITNMDDIDYYTFSLNSAGYVSITFSHAYRDESNTRWTVSILNSNAGEMLSRDFTPNTLKPVTTCCLGLPAGSYYLKISRDTSWYAYSDAEYKFTLNKTTSSVWETESNDNVAYRSDPIKLNTNYHGAITNMDDTDYYQFTVATTGTYHFIFSHPYADISYSRWAVAVLNDNLGEISKFTYYPNATAKVTNDVYLSKGSYYLKITRDTGWYVFVDSTYTFMVKTGAGIPDPDKIDLSKAKVTGLKDQVYSGKAFKPEPTVKLSGKTLVKGKDYTLSYKNNKNIGKATVTVAGKGEYTGSVEKSFDILPKAVALSSVKTAGKKALTVQWKKGTKVTGYQVEYSLKADFSGAKSVTIAKASTTKYTIEKLKGGKKYYVRVRAFAKVNGKKYYSEWSEAKSRKTKK